MCKTGIYMNNEKYGQAWERCGIEEILFVASPVAGEGPILVKDCIIGTLTNDAGKSREGEMVHGIDVIRTKILQK